MNAALIELGWNALPQGPASTAELAERLGVVADHHRQLGCLLDLMAQHDRVARAQGGFQAAPLAAGADTAALWRELWSDFPIAQAEAILVRRCGENLAKVLRGDVDPLQLLFPDGSSSVAEHLYQDSPSNRIYNTLVQKAVARIARSLPAGRPLRVLELGGGTGGLTSYVLPVLPRDSTHYVFTDLGQSLVAEAKRRFNEFPFVEYRALDIDKDPAEQGIEPHSFDLVLASDVLPLEQAKLSEARYVTIRVPIAGWDRALGERLRDILGSNRGECPVTLELVRPGSFSVAVAANVHYRVRPGPTLKEELERLLGPDALELSRTNGARGDEQARP